MHYERCRMPSVSTAIEATMAEYKLAKTFVDRAIDDGKEPLLASWF